MKIGDNVIVIDDEQGTFPFKNGDTGVITAKHNLVGEKTVDIRIDNNKREYIGCYIRRFKLYNKHINWRKRLE